MWRGEKRVIEWRSVLVSAVPDVLRMPEVRRISDEVVVVAAVAVITAITTCVTKAHYKSENKERSGDDHEQTMERLAGFLNCNFAHGPV